MHPCWQMPGAYSLGLHGLLHEYGHPAVDASSERHREQQSSPAAHSTYLPACHRQNAHGRLVAKHAPMAIAGRPAWRAVAIRGGFMERAPIFFVVSLGAVVAAACGGSSTGGNTADGGHPGISSGSSPGSSGDSGGSNPEGAPSMPSNPLTCMAGTCGSGEVCCIAGGGGGGDGGRGGTTCQTGSCPMGSFQLCSSAADCPAPQTCMPLGPSLAMCRTPPCTGGSCGSGQVCCTGANLFGFFPACQMATSCPRGSFLLCGSSADCPSGEFCGPGGGGGGGTVCAPRVADAGAGGG